MTDTIPGVVALSDTDVRVHRLLGPSMPPSESRGFTALVPVAGIDNSLISFAKRFGGFGNDPIRDLGARTRWQFRAYNAALRKIPFVREVVQGRYSRIWGVGQQQFFYSVRWSLVDRVAVRRELGGQDVEPLTWLLFESNYTGDLDDYVGAFLDTLPEGLMLHFGTSWGYPTTSDRQLFLAWLSRWLIPVDFYWAREDFRSDLVTFRANHKERTLVSSHRWSSYLLPLAPEASTIALRDLLDDLRVANTFPFDFALVPAVHHGRTALLPNETWTSMHAPGTSFDRSCNLLLSFSHDLGSGRDVLAQLLPKSESLAAMTSFFDFDVRDPDAVAQFETGQRGGELTLITYDLTGNA